MDTRHGDSRALRRLNASQALVLGFFLAAWLGLIVILWLAPEVYDRMLKLGPGAHPVAHGAFLAAISAFLLLLSVGVIRRWRWVFWLILVAFLSGLLRLPVAVLQLTGTLASADPDWYILAQGIIGVVQFAIGLALLRGYRREGVWGRW